MKWYEPNAENLPWVRALAGVRHLAHVQAIIFAIDQYAEAALATGTSSSTGPMALAAEEDDIP